MWVAIGVFTFFAMLLTLTVLSVLRTGNKAPKRSEVVARYTKTISFVRIRPYILRCVM